MLFSQDEIDAFRTAMLINPGILEMAIADKHYRFTDLKAMRDHLAWMERSLDAEIPVPRTRYARTNKGLG